jgi:hypothetical protein
MVPKRSLCVPVAVESPRDLTSDNTAGVSCFGEYVEEVLRSFLLRLIEAGLPKTHILCVLSSNGTPGSWL